MRDLDADATTLVSRADGPTGPGGDGSALDVVISGDGRFVAFQSNADNLSGDDDETFTDIFVRDVSAATTRLVSRAPGPAGPGGDASSVDPSITADGRYVAFASEADNISSQDVDPNVDPQVNDVFRRDLLGPAPGSPSGAGVSGGASAAVCKALPPPPRPSPGDPDDITLTTGQLLINQRIDQAAIRRANGVQDWIDGGIEGRDLCQGALGARRAGGRDRERPGRAAARLRRPQPAADRRGARQAGRPEPDHAHHRPAADQPAHLPGGHPAPERASRRAWTPGSPGATWTTAPWPSRPSSPGCGCLPPRPRPARRRPPRPGSPRPSPATRSQVTLTTAQLLINQRISQAAVRRANELMARIEDGLLASDVGDGTLTALDLAPGVAP